jgi:hypothetical protein
MPESLIDQIKELENLIDAHEDYFLLYHFKLKPKDSLLGITGLYFGSEHIKVNYILVNGMHIADSITWEQFNTWRETL